MTDTSRMEYALERCLDRIGDDANQFGTASVYGPLLGLILEALGRPETADEYVINLRMEEHLR